MTETQQAPRVRIADWSAISPYGSGRVAFADGVRSGEPAVSKLDPDRWDVAADFAALVPGFDTRAELGKKGTRTMNRVTGLSVSTVGSLIGQLDGLVTSETGLVLGTTHGSAQSSMEFTRGSLAASAPHHVESGLIPYAVMNGAAGQCAIWHGLKGPNATIAASRPSSLLAINYARRLLLSGRASSMLCGAAEEFSEARYWLSHADHRASGDPGDLVLGEGCVMFALTVDPTVPAQAELLAVHSMVAAPDDAEEVIARCIEATLQRAAVDAADVWAVSRSGGPGDMAGAEERVLDKRFGARVQTSLIDLVGETDSVSAAFQLAALLTLAVRDEDAVDRCGVVTSVDDNGTVCVAVVRFVR